MKIALASDWFLPRLGGIELQMRDLASGLRARGHDVEILTAFPGPPQVDGIRVHRLGAPRLPRADIVFTPGAFTRMAQQLRAGRYDLVHVHIGIVAPAAYGYAASAQSLGLPTVATIHSVLSHFEIPQWLVGMGLGIRGWRASWSAVSSVVAASVRPLLGDRSVSILPNGVDSHWWRARGAAAAHGRDVTSGAPKGLRVVSVMRLHPRKRPSALVRAIAEANRRLPTDKGMRLEIIGDGREFHRLRRLIVRAGVQAVVSLDGWKSRDEVRYSLQQSDLFVLPSRLEAFGIAALEARCAGVPVIAMREAGARDFLRNGTDGILVDSDQELVEKLVRMALEPGQLAKLRHGASAPPVGFEWPAVIAAHERLYAGARAG